jgi:hypothetical protein
MHWSINKFITLGDTTRRFEKEQLVKHKMFSECACMRRNRTNLILVFSWITHVAMHGKSK